MPIKKDETGKRWVEMDLLVPGTPEQVWDAMATGPGNAAWFVGGEIEPREGGRFVLDFGHGVTTSGEVTAWEPPHHFGYVERGWMEGAPPVATEITITGRTGDRCVVRMVHSLFAETDDWDDQLEGFENGWPGFFAILRIYLARYAGSPAASFIAVHTVAADSLPTWRRLVEALSLSGVDVSERRSVASGPEPFSGVVEHVYQDATQRYVVLRLDAPGPGVLLVGTSDPSSMGGSPGTNNVSVCRYLYGEDARAQVGESEARWREWLGETFGGQGDTTQN